MRCALQQRFEIEFLDSIFPLVEAWLETTDHQKALMYVSAKKMATMDHYRSKIDYLFCELFVEFQKPCRQFYKGDGEVLGFLLEPEQRTRFEAGMLEALDGAYWAFCKKRQLSWVQFRLSALRAVA